MIKNPVARILLRICGVFCILFGFLFIVAGATELPDIYFFFFGLIFGGALILGGFALFAITKKDRDEIDPAKDSSIVSVSSETLIPLRNKPEAETGAAAAAAGAAGAAVAGAVGAVAAGAAAAAGAGSKAATAPEPSSPGSLEQMFLRSVDAVATMKDLVRHESTPDKSTPDVFAADVLLTGADIDEWTPPVALARILSRTNRFWLNSEDEYAPADQEKLVKCEMLLNLSRDIGVRRSRGQIGEDAFTPEGIRSEAAEILFEVFSRAVEPWDPTADIELAYPDPSMRITNGEWAARNTIIAYLEDTPFPLRVVYSTDTNVKKRTCMVGLVIPSPTVFAPLVNTPAEAAALARSWALRLGLACAQNAFGPTIDRVCVNMRDYLQDGNIFSLDLTRAALERLLAFCDTYPVREGQLPSDPACVFSIRQDGWLEAIQPLYNPAKEQLSDPARFADVELSDAPAPPALASTFRIERMSELGINENASRINALKTLDPVLNQDDASTEAIVSALVAIKDGAGSDTVLAQAAEHTSKALVEGTLDISDASAIREDFVAGTPLDRANHRALELVDPEKALDEIAPHLLEEALTLMERELEVLDSAGTYEDTDTYVWRYFGSTLERMLYNREFHDGSCEVRLVPDAYHFAHLTCARFLTMLGRLEEARKHEEVLDRISPLSIAAGLQKVRTLEHMTHVFEAAEVLNHLIDISCNAEDAAVCLYRMAYMQWKLGRSDLAVACYTRCKSWNHEMYAKADEELESLLMNEPELERLNPDQALDLLKEAGINPGLSKERVDMLRAGAIVACDCNVFSVAAPLLAMLHGITRSDVVLSIYRSLEPFN